MLRNVRELTMDDIELVIDYFLCASPQYLLQLGVDASKLPPKNEWQKIIADDLEQPFEKRKLYYVIWEIDNISVGHSHINEIDFGRHAYMHLHLWDANSRQKGNGTYFVSRSLQYYFKNFRLEKIYSQPYALNPAPNKTLEKAGFTFVKRYENCARLDKF